MSRPFRILICLLLGVVTAIAVAWACLAVKPLPDPKAINTIVFTHDPGTRVWWIGRAERGPGWRIYSMYADGPWVSGGRIEPEQLPPWVIGDERNRDNGTITAVVGCGWPILCLTARQTGVDDTDAAIARTGQVSTGIGPQAVRWDAWERALPLEGDQTGFIRRPRVLPFGVLWRGLILNTLVFAVLWMIPLAISPLRRVMRRRRGRCPDCGYDLRGSEHAACPECGAQTVMPAEPVPAKAGSWHPVIACFRVTSDLDSRLRGNDGGFRGNDEPPRRHASNRTTVPSSTNRRSRRIALASIFNRSAAAAR